MISFKVYDGSVEFNSEFSLKDSQGKLNIFPLALFGNSRQYLLNMYGEKVFNLARQLFAVGARKIEFDGKNSVTVYAEKDVDINWFTSKAGEILEEVYRSEIDETNIAEEE